MLKCNRAYLDMANRNGNTQIWSILPAYFRKTQREMAETTNSLENFLSSEEVMYDPEFYMPYNMFRDACTAYLRRSGYNALRWNKDVYLGPFQKRDLKISDKPVEKMFPRQEGTRRRCVWVFGVDLRVNVEQGEAT
jgi:hypothetical protein